MDEWEVAQELIFDNDEEEDRERIRRPRFIRERSEHFDDLDDSGFVRRFRLSKRSCILVLELIDYRLEFPTDKNNAVSPINQLLLCLRFYATCSTQMSAADFSGVSEATANRIIHRFTAAIASLHRRFIYFPRTDQEMRETQTEFYMISRFPRVLGAVDCTHVKIRSPGGEHAEYFRDRERYFSLNCQAICNANLEFLNIVARWPGSSHDQTIFDHSRVRADFENNLYNGSLLLGDSAYACRRYMMPPLDNPTSPEEILYNESQIRTRNPVERIFGVWKRRFPILALGINVRLNNAMPIIVATGVLFNLLRRENELEAPNDPLLQLPMPWEDLIQMGQINGPRNDDHERDRVVVLRGRQYRQVLINDYFRTLLENFNN